MIRARVLIHAANPADPANGNTERKSSARHSRAPGIFVLLILAILTWLADFRKRERGEGGERARKSSRKADYLQGPESFYFSSPFSRVPFFIILFFNLYNTVTL